MVEKMVQVIERELSVWFAVCYGNKKRSVLGVDLICQTVS